MENQYPSGRADVYCISTCQNLRQCDVFRNQSAKSHLRLPCGYWRGAIPISHHYENNFRLSGKNFSLYQSTESLRKNFRLCQPTFGFRPVSKQPRHHRRGPRSGCLSCCHIVRRSWLLFADLIPKPPPNCDELHTCTYQYTQTHTHPKSLMLGLSSGPLEACGWSVWLELEPRLASSFLPYFPLPLVPAASCQRQIARVEGILGNYALPVASSRQSCVHAHRRE
ncbi:hypothetical protein MAPG_06201 [Magnaporthiopsis poae ATCC 64411]|uniref:Uncharacterized protein n=1 Tax=Magnaporthiopsis poae (strain ATCC 64411 / 73-15) TaxID=644358 RepID=A0A0C4E1E1_MAGP6|nr:hypothetical protein MAPG_06201 [Magnaporthiopsis poae ATCC 64411]